MKKQIENKKMDKKVYISIKLYKKSYSIKKIKFTFTPNVLLCSMLGVNIVFIWPSFRLFLICSLCAMDVADICDGCRKYFRRPSQVER